MGKTQSCCQVPNQLGEKPGDLFVALDLKILIALQNLGLERLLSGKELLFLQTTQVWFPAPTKWLKAICNSSARECDASNLFRPRHAYGAQTFTEAKQSET